MRRLARHAFTALSLLSLLMYVATVVLWVWSYPAGEEWAYSELHDHGFTFVAHACTLVSARGRITVGLVSDAGTQRAGWFHRPPENSGFTHRDLSVTIVKQPKTFVEKLGFEHTAAVGSDSSRQYSRETYVVPHWFVVVLAAVLPAVWLVGRIRRRKARQQGLCPQCGYDLRATPDRCPECGATAYPPDRSPAN